MTPSTPLPDAAEQTGKLHHALTAAIARLQSEDAPGPRLAAQELETLRELLAPPPESYPGLTEVDDALAKAIDHFATLSCVTDEAEIRQTLRTLRRLLLIDRRRIDPDPEQHTLDMAIILRQAWLIGHRCGLMEARAQYLATREVLAQLPPAAPKRAVFEEQFTLLTQYLEAQEGYGHSIRAGRDTQPDTGEPRGTTPKEHQKKTETE